MTSRRTGRRAEALAIPPVLAGAAADGQGVGVEAVPLGLAGAGVGGRAAAAAAAAHVQRVEDAGGADHQLQARLGVRHADVGRVQIGVHVGLERGLDRLVVDVQDDVLHAQHRDLDR